MVAPLYTDVTAGIRSMLDDTVTTGGATYTDAFLQRFVEMAQQTMVTYLTGNSVERLKFRTETPLTVTAGANILDYAVSAGGTAGTGILNILPDDLTVPDCLWEAKIGGLNEDFFEMIGPAPLPNSPTTDVLRFWDWRDGRLHLLGATVDRLVRMDYFAFLPAVDPAKRMRIVDSGNALVCLAACYAARSKGAYNLADRMATFGDDGIIRGQAGVELTQIITAQIKAQQAEPVRRRPWLGFDRYAHYSTRRR